MQEHTNFTITIEAQEMRVHYRPHTFGDYAHFEFMSPYEPARRILISETGYKSHFSPMFEVEEAPSVEEYAVALALAILHGSQVIEDDCDEAEEPQQQLALF